MSLPSPRKSFEFIVVCRGREPLCRCGTDKEYTDFVTLSASSNTFPSTGSPVSLTFEVRYDLPSLRKEGVISPTLSFVDNDGATFQKVADIKIAP